MAGSGCGCGHGSHMLLESDCLGIDCDWDFSAGGEGCLALRGSDWAARTGHSTSWPYTTAVAGMTTPSG